MKILVVGDEYFLPEWIKEGLESGFSGTEMSVEITTLKFPYPDEELALTQDSSIPSGMALDAHPSVNFERYRVREHYGEPLALVDHIKDNAILIVHGAAVPGDVIRAGKQLKVIFCLRGGPANIDMDAAKERGIAVLNTPGAKNAQAVAEMTIGLVLAHLRHTIEASNFLRHGRYRPVYYRWNNAGVEIHAKTFGLIGFGQVGQIVAKILRGFGCKIIAYDPFALEKTFLDFDVQRVELAELLQQADLVSLHARAPKGGAKLIGRNELALMKPTAILVNTARGHLLDYKALYEALTTRRIAGAILDVFGDEPLSFYMQLLNLPCVTATPHISGSSRETVARGIGLMVDKLREHLLRLPAVSAAQRSTS